MGISNNKDKLKIPISEKVKIEKKKLIGVALSIVIASSSLTGCFNDKFVPPTIVPEKQIFEDSYPRNKEINDTLTYTVDYAKQISTNTTFGGERIDTLHLFDPIQIQVDDWECIVLGHDTMGDITAIVDKYNENYVKTRTDAVIKERKEAIEKEYNEAKAKAEAAGKTYDKPMKEVRTDDIVFTAPYTYQIQTSNEDNAEIFEYSPTYLIDSTRVQKMILQVSKYGIPYVSFYFTVGGDYNQGIIQESDWVLTNVEAAYVNGYLPAEGQATKIPEFIDKDYKNKAAKKNIFINGNISLDGSGFKWETIGSLCEHLGLDGSRGYSSNVNSFHQSTDGQFAYYSIKLLENPFVMHPELLNKSDVMIPAVELVATFDPVSQVCINWAIYTYNGLNYKKDIEHTLSSPIAVNIHDFQVDTTDYEGMRTSMATWIANNSVKTTTKYVVMDPNTNKIEGTLDNGTSNVYIEPVVDGTQYVCLSVDEKDPYGNQVATYIAADKYAESEVMGPGDRETFLEKHSKTWKIACVVYSEDNKLLGVVTNPISESIMEIAGSAQLSETLYIVDYKETETGYQDIRLMPASSVSQLLLTYAKTYQLTDAQIAQMQSLAKETGPFAVKGYVESLIAEAERIQKENANKKPNKEDSTTPTETKPETETTQPEATEATEATTEPSTSPTTEGTAPQETSPTPTTANTEPEQQGETTPAATEAVEKNTEPTQSAP